jgi:hypothetical protein
MLRTGFIRKYKNISPRVGNSQAGYYHHSYQGTHDQLRIKVKKETITFTSLPGREERT